MVKISAFTGNEDANICSCTYSDEYSKVVEISGLSLFKDSLPCRIKDIFLS